MKYSFLTIPATALLAVAVFGSNVAFAQTTSAVSTPVTHMSVSINQNGKIELDGTIASVSGSTLTINSWGGTWTVNAANAKLVRRFGGTSAFSEFQIGDNVEVTGTAVQGSLSVTATSVKDDSIQAKGDKFTGTVSNVNVANNTFSLSTRNRGVQQVNVGTTTIQVSGGGTITLGNIASGVKASVVGIWDRALSVITANKITVHTNATTTASVSPAVVVPPTSPSNSSN